jgi:hypothetical protein
LVESLDRLIAALGTETEARGAAPATADGIDESPTTDSAMATGAQPGIRFQALFEERPVVAYSDAAANEQPPPFSLGQWSISRALFSLGDDANVTATFDAFDVQTLIRTWIPDHKLDMARYWEVRGVALGRDHFSFTTNEKDAHLKYSISKEYCIAECSKIQNYLKC